VKTFSSDLAATYASGSSTLCACLKVLRSDGVAYLFTSADRDVTVGGEIYVSAHGLSISNLVNQSSLAVDNMEFPVLPDESTYPQVDIIAGRWDKAQFWLFECDYTDPSLAGGSNAVGEASRDDINLLKRGWGGESDTLRSSRKFELRGLKQALQQPVGAVTSKTCRYRLGSTAMPAGLCLVDLSSFTNEYPVTGVTSRHVFTCSGASEADDYYGDGIAISLDGANEGYERKVKTFAASIFTLAMEFPFTVSIADNFRFIAGCRKRLTEDCQAKFDNVLNFGGEPHMTGIDAITADPEVSV
jgi:uncharacterized phage protein (TIGR02218 family)